MKKMMMGCLLVLFALGLSVSVSADTLDHQDPSRAAQVGIEAVVPETVTVKISMAGGRFKVGNTTYTNQATLVLPYASQLVVTAVDGKLTHVTVDFGEIPSTYQLATDQLTVEDMRADGVVTLTYQKTEPTEPTKPSDSPKSSDSVQPSDAPQPSDAQAPTLPMTGFNLPFTGEAVGLGLGVIGLAVVLVWLIIVIKRRREEKED